MSFKNRQKADLSPYQVDAGGNMVAERVIAVSKQRSSHKQEWPGQKPGVIGPVNTRGASQEKVKETHPPLLLVGPKQRH